jgi:hypothetical protein
MNTRIEAMVGQTDLATFSDDQIELDISSGGFWLLPDLHLADVSDRMDVPCGLYHC